MPFLDPSYRCFTFNQKDKVLTIGEYIALLCIETSNPNKVFWKKMKGVSFVKKMSQIMGMDMTTISQMKTTKGKNSASYGNF